ncbi:MULTISPECIES: hypothetical protein [Yersinia]|jgi:hypothetical protein|uniref:Uncharacterized protein n=1 Tax=Yersinia intermedia TaxID=631 RepID=A0A0T9N6H9_YERIN|nr:MULTISPECIES: hypothetical protein [Yersinia]ARB83676.1 hypothetical protein A6J67_06235 [Yersinia sp. FDAARGOS_228]AVL37457.1 hypothetical protein CEQ36_18985 [Yersinia intermedia]MDA5512380.1 hypothetical protein [Yersinia intermedia]MDA5547975.1 hypothetical protein [Yersinia massiliensis]MDN0117231.1 hypothetical protein [Yersinia intermedia]
MTEKLNKVLLTEGSLQNSQLEDFRYSSGSLELILSSGDNEEGSKVKVLFDWIYSFRVTDEGDLLKMQEEQKGEMLTGLYLVENSKYLEWFNEQSGNVHDEIAHYMLSTVDDVIDILASISPSISVSS